MKMNVKIYFMKYSQLEDKELESQSWYRCLRKTGILSRIFR